MPGLCCSTGSRLIRRRARRNCGSPWGSPWPRQPDLRIIRIMDGSLLDSESLEVIRKAAVEKDYQVWIESVDETGKIGIVIEDGQIVADNQSQPSEHTEEQPKGEKRNGTTTNRRIPAGLVDRRGAS